ncbi:MAG: fibronectin type III domain-containing protein, partial [Candidatus Marinimicrobia bacterium]|nr:fibronectin type III domain-containing protein [Candidatus Neomarinimicrobiota bacterium]
MKYFSIILTVMVTALIGRATEPQTGWFYDVSTQQAFYLFDEITIDGLVVEGDGSGEGDGGCELLGTCDVVGAFRRGVCQDPGYQNSQQLCELFSVWNTDEEICIGWRYADSDGATTVVLNGKEGAEGTNTFTYANAGESAYIKIYDSSSGSILDLNPSAELPGWELLQIFTIEGTSTANNTFGCTEAAACNYDASATADDGSCWSANAGCSCADGAGSEADCAGVCNGSSALDDCGVCDGGNASMDCAGVCDGSSTTDNCGVCDDDTSNDDASCTGCTNADGDNYDSGNTIDDGSCVITVPPATNLAATPGAARVSLEWDAAVDNFTESSAGYTYDVYQDGVVVKSTSQTSSQITGLDSETNYCFTVLAIHNQYGASADQSNEACATPEEAAGDPTWRIQLTAEIDSYDQFQFSGNEDWLLHDDENFLGVATDATYGYDSAHDAPDPPQGPGNYIKLFFDHPGWNEWVTHFTEDIVLEDDDFFSTNLTQWNVRVQSDVPGSTVIRFKTDIGVIPANYELYVELDGNYTRLHHSEETAIEFYMDGSGQKDLAVYIGNVAPQAPDNLASVGNYNSINLDWDSDGDDLNDIGNRYPAISYNVYRDDAPSDYNSNSGGPGNGPGGCGGLLTGGFGQGNTDYLDDVDLYADYPGEGLLQESTYSYTVTGSNDAGESSEGHTVRTSGGDDTFHDGRSSSTEATTGLNADPNSVPVHMDSPNGTNLEAGLYEIPHNWSPDANRIVIPIGAWGSDDPDFPYDLQTLHHNLYYFDYQWTQVGGQSDLQDIIGLTSPQLSFTVANTQKDEDGNLNDEKTYTWNLRTDSQHPVKTSGSCGVWTSEMHLHSDNQDISVTIQPEPNNNPIAADARDLPRFGDGASVVTSDDYDNIAGEGNDFNDYEDDANVNGAQFGVWYEPHDNNIVHEIADGIINYFADNADFGNNNADLYFTAIDSDDDDGMCDVGGPPTCAWDCPGFFDTFDADGEPLEDVSSDDICQWIVDTVDDGSCLSDCNDNMMDDANRFAAECSECLDAGDCSDIGGCPDGYVQDCSGDGDCISEGLIGDGWCDGVDQPFGADLTCYEDDGGDCADGANSCPDGPDGTQYVEDCSGDGDCAPEAWIGDDYCDGTDQQWGFDLTCYDNDGGDCDDGRAGDDGRTPDRDAWWIPERYVDIISNDARSAVSFCDEQTYEWYYTKGAAAAFNYLDVNANGIYDIGERFSLIDNNAIVQEFGPEEFWDDNESGFWDAGEGFVDDNGNGIFDVGTDLGDFIPPTKVQFEECNNCIDGQFTSN